MKNKVAIIIVNWNGKQFLKDCLESIYDQSYKYFDVYFVDNGSADDSVDFVKNNYSKVRIIEVGYNSGFAKGNNIGIGEALKDDAVGYILTLNNDTKINSDFLEKLVDAICEDDKIGSVAPKMKFFYENNLIDSVGVLIHSDGGGISRGSKEIDSGQYNAKEEVFGVCAGAALYRKEMMIDIIYKNEYFDNTFFAYYEDLDLAWRARLRGWRSITCSEAVVHHIHSATGISHSPFKAFHVNRNRFFIIIKDYPWWFMLKALALTPWRYLKLLNSIIIKKGPSHKLKERTNIFVPFLIVIKGWASVVRYLPEMIGKRNFIQKNKKVSSGEIKDWFKKYSVKMDDMIYK